MSFRVRLLPSGHEFETAPHETLLEAGLRAGLALSYNCASGTCGKCRVRVISGQARESGPHDYAFSEAEKAAGFFLLCRATALSDLVLEAIEAEGPADIPEQEVVAKVSRLERPTEEVVILRLRTGRSRTLRFLAGQSIRVELEDGAQAELPIASCPCSAAVLELHVPRLDSDPFSIRVFQRLRVGDWARIRGPYGNFVLAEDERAPLLLVAYGIGFGPMKGLIEHALALEWEAELALYRLGPIGEGEPYLGNQCRVWADAFEQFRFACIGLEDGAEGSPADLARVWDKLRDEVPDLLRREVYVAAPGAWVRDLESRLAAAGHPPQRLHRLILETPLAGGGSGSQ